MSRKQILILGILGVIAVSLYCAVAVLGIPLLSIFSPEPTQAVIVNLSAPSATRSPTRPYATPEPTIGSLEPTPTGTIVVHATGTTTPTPSPFNSLPSTDNTVTIAGPGDIVIKARAYINHEKFGSLTTKDYSDPIQLELDFTGGAAIEAYRYSQAQITATIDTSDPFLELIELGDSFAKFPVIDHAATNFFTDELEHPPDGFRLKALFVPVQGITQTETVSGTVIMHSIDPEQVVVIENLESFKGTSSTELESSRLTGVGDFSLQLKDDVVITVEGQELDDMEARIIDAQEKVWLPTSRSSFIVDGTETKSLGFSIPDTSLTGARLEIILAFNVMKIPFEFATLTIRQ